MAKGKGKNVNGHLRARLDYLHKAATYLQSKALSSRQKTQQRNNEDKAADDEKSTRTVPHIISSNATAPEKVDEKQETTTIDHLPNLSRAYISNLRGISLKTQLRLPQDVKRSFCKRCDTLLVPGVNYTQEIRNASRDGRKPWADVRVVRCTTCCTEKRYPQTERRGKKLAERRKEKEDQAAKP